MIKKMLFVVLFLLLLGCADDELLDDARHYLVLQGVENPKICEDIVDDFRSSDCFFDLAVKTGDGSYCGQVSHDEEHAGCIAATTDTEDLTIEICERAGRYGKGCFDRLGTFEACTSHPSGPGCVERYSDEIFDYWDCVETGFDDWSCLVFFGKEMDDIYWCDDMESYDQLKKCLEASIRSADDLDACEEMLDDRDQCLIYLAFHTNDSSVCQDVEDYNRRDYSCYRLFLGYELLEDEPSMEFCDRFTDLSFEEGELTNREACIEDMEYVISYMKKAEKLKKGYVEQ